MLETREEKEIYSKWLLLGFTWINLFLGKVHGNPRFLLELLSLFGLQLCGKF